MPETLDLTYPAIQSLYPNHLAKERTESSAFLAWFLEHYYRLDEIAAQDAVCDGPDDKGIDGVYVDDNLETVDVFQGKLLRNTKRTLGDTQLKEFMGTLLQFAEPAKVREIAETSGNTELRNLLSSCNAAENELRP